MSLKRLGCLASELDAVFTHFYHRMLSQPDFAAFFRDEAMVTALIDKQKALFLRSLTLDDGSLREIYVALGARHYDLKVPFVDFLAAMTILEEQLLSIAALKPDPQPLIDALFAFFRLIRGFIAKGYLHRMLEDDAADIDMYLETVNRSTEIDISFATERILWLRQLLHAIQTEDQSAAPPPQLPPEIMHSITDAVAQDGALKRYIDQTLARIEIDATNVFYFITNEKYEEVLSLYRELMNIYKLSLMLTNVVTIASSNTLVTSLSRDPLTGLLTRASLNSIIERELAIASSSRYPLSLIVCDIDHFKQINDTHGHNAGDDVLRQVARIIQQSIRATDFAFRYGGEEFLLVLRGASEMICRNLAEHIRTVIARTPFRIEQTSLQVTASFGVSTFRAPFPASFAEMFKGTDDKLYQAKRCGRNRVVG